MNPDQDGKKEMKAGDVVSEEPGGSTSETDITATEFDSSEAQSRDDYNTSLASQGKEGKDGKDRCRREKRLYLNRESARARRHRKKIHIETLVEQVAALSKWNHGYRVDNASLTEKVKQLENNLAAARSLILDVMSEKKNADAIGMASVQGLVNPTISTSGDSEAIQRLSALQAHNMYTPPVARGIAHSMALEGLQDSHLVKTILDRETAIANMLRQTTPATTSDGASGLLYLLSGLNSERIGASEVRVWLF